MSWSMQIGPAKKDNLEEAIEIAEVPSNITGPALDQVYAAFDAARLISKSVPGPYILLSLSGHANGVGWQKKEGYANDCINVNVIQLMEEDLQYHKK